MATQCDDVPKNSRSGKSFLKALFDFPEHRDAIVRAAQKIVPRFRDAGEVSRHKPKPVITQKKN